jgi:hypothetical protein
MIDRIALVAQMLCDIGDPKAPLKIKTRSVFAGMGDILLEVHGYLTKRFELIQKSLDDSPERPESMRSRNPPTATHSEEPTPAEKYAEDSSSDLRATPDDKQARMEASPKGLWDE